VPQIAIQIWYISCRSIDEVALLSAAFSLISIAVTILSVFTQRMILRKQSFVVIGFDVTGNSIEMGMTRKIRGIKKEISSVFAVHKRAVDIEQGLYLSAGRVHLELQIDVNEDGDGDLEQKMQNAIDNGTVAVIFQKRWKLECAPVISNLSCTNMGVDNGSEVGRIASVSSTENKVPTPVTVERVQTE